MEEILESKRTLRIFGIFPVLHRRDRLCPTEDL